MKHSKWLLPPMVALASWLAIAVGCQPSVKSVSDGAGYTAQQPSGKPDAHDHEAEPPVPTNFNEGLELLNKQRAVIKAAVEAERPEDAHEALHDVGHSLEALPALASSNPKIAHPMYIPRRIKNYSIGLSYRQSCLASPQKVASEHLALPANVWLATIMNLLGIQMFASAPA